MSGGEPDDARIIPFPTAAPAPCQITELFRQHESKLLRFLQLRLGSESDAHDVAQTAFLRLWQRRESLIDDDLVALLFVTARNLATDLIRRRSRLRLLSTDQGLADVRVQLIPDERSNPERAISAKRDCALVLKLVDELPVKCAAAFVSYKFYHMSYSEIAFELGIGESMVRKYVLRAIAHCARRFEDLGGGL